MRLVATLLAATLLAGSAGAAEPGQPIVKLEDMPATTYRVDPSHSAILFSFGHMGFSTTYARVAKFDATLDFNPRALEQSKIEVTADASSIDTNDLALNKKLDSKEFFDVAEHPTATFKSTRVEKTGDKTGKVYGDLTIHGITRPAVFDITLNGVGSHPMTGEPMMGFSGRGELKRSDFGLGAHVPMVSDAIALLIEGEFSPQK